jgi:hypothetical protein
LTFIIVEAKEIEIIIDNLAVFSVLLGLLLLGAIVSGYVATSVDTEDPVVCEQLAQKANGERFDDSQYEYFCHICKCCVHEGSKHCKTCNKCVH